MGMDGIGDAMRVGLGLFEAASALGQSKPATGAAGNEVSQYAGGIAGEQQGPLSIFDILGKIFGLVAPPPVTASDAVHEGVRAHTGVSDSFSSGGFSGKGSATADAFADVDAEGKATLGADGLRLQGHAGARIGAQVQAGGQLDTPLGSISGHVLAAAELYADVAGEAHVGLTGAEADGKAKVGAMAMTRADGHADLVGGLVKADATAHAESGTGAEATGDVGLTYSPLTAVVKGSAGAFAGARAGFDAKAGCAGASVGVHGEAWSGVGAKAKFEAGIKDGKFSLSMGIGAALGVGGFLEVNLELDLHDFGSAAKSIVSSVGNLIGGVAKGIGDFFGGIFSGVANLFGGGKGDGSKANQVIDGAGKKPLQPSTVQGDAPASAPKSLSDFMPKDAELETERDDDDDTGLSADTETDSPDSEVA